MRILMLCPLLSSSSMITAYPMAVALSKKHDVRIVGPLMGGQPFIRDAKLRMVHIEPRIMRPQQLAMLGLYRSNMKRLMNDGFDVIHAFKLLPHTAPVASAVKRRTGKKFVLSIDDYDVSASRNPLKRAVVGWAERACRNADATTVSSTYLQKIYGGDVIYQVPNEKLFLRSRSRPEVKRRLGIGGKTMILHAGTFYPHKGLDVLITAVQRLGRKDLALVLAGTGSEDSRLRRLAGPETIFTGRLPMERVAELTAACDIYAIPTKDTEYARAEIPGKIFEPMMLGKPVVASRISDVPLILDSGRCGLLPRPGDADALAQSIGYLLDNPREAERLGRKAKERYFERYCMKHFKKKIGVVYSKLEDGL